MAEHRRVNISAVQRALAHPLRARILVELEKRAASPSQVAAEIGETVGIVSYHVRVLMDAELVELVGTMPRRGALQHFYRARLNNSVGVSLTLDQETADKLLADIKALVQTAREAADAKPKGRANLVVVVHPT